MRRLYQAGAFAALGAGLGASPFAIGCWGDEFTPAPAVGGLGGASSANGVASPTSGAGAMGGTGPATTGGVLREGCTAVLPASADTYVDGMFPDDNYDHKALQDDELEIYQFGATSQRILIYFDVQFWLQDYDVTAARLELVLAEVPDSFGSIDVHKILLPGSASLPGWEERFVTWNRYAADALWAAPGGDFDPTASASAPMEADWRVGTVISWDVTDDVKAFHSGTPNYGWVLKETNDPVDGLGIGYAFYGRESEVVLMDPEDPAPSGDDSPDAGLGPGDPGSEPAPSMPETTTGTVSTDAVSTATTTATTATAGTSDGAGGSVGTTDAAAGGSMAMPDAGVSDGGMEEDDGPGVLPRLLVDICPP